MKKIVTLLSVAFAIGALFFSCSKTELEVTTFPETRAIEEEDISPRFLQDNIEQSAAIGLAYGFLDRIVSFYPEKVLGYKPLYIQYSKSFDAGGISFRGISWDGGSNPNKPLFFYASGPNTAQDIMSLKGSEDIYEMQSDNGSIWRKGKVYKYSANYGSELWLMVNEISVPEFEEIVHFGGKP